MFGLVLRGLLFLCSLLLRPLGGRYRLLAAPVRSRLSDARGWLTWHGRRPPAADASKPANQQHEHHRRRTPPCPSAGPPAAFHRDLDFLVEKCSLRNYRELNLSCQPEVLQTLNLAAR